MITLNDKEDKGKSEYLDKLTKGFGVVKNPKCSKVAKINKE